MPQDITVREQIANRSSQAIAWAPGLNTAHTGLRGLFALWILLFHSIFYSVGWNLHGSALMPLFYLLSGYSLAIGYGGRAGYNEEEQRKQVARFDITGFYKNRFARIAPVYYVVTLAALPLVIFGHGWVPPNELWQVLASNLAAVQMWLPLPAIFGKNIDGPGWTISTLAFFYLIFPLLLKRYRNHTQQSLNRSITVLMVVQAVVFFAVYFAVSRIFNASAGFWAAHASPISRFPVFEMGVVAGLLVLRQGAPDRDTNVKIMSISNTNGNRWARTVDLCAGIFALFIIIFSVFHAVTKIDLGASFWMQGIFPFTLLQIIVGLSMAERSGTSVTMRLLNWPPMLFLGKISLPLYLVHEPIIQYVAWIAHPDKSWTNGLSTPMPVWGIAVVIPASIVLAVILERCVELPARKYLRKRF